MLNWIKFLVAFIVTIGSVLFAIIFFSAHKPIANAISDAETAVLQANELTTITDGDVYNGTQSYVTVFGINSKDQATAVLVPTDNRKENHQIIQLAKGVSSKEAVALVKDEEQIKELRTVRLGREDQTVIWEVVFIGENDSLNYVYVDFESGKVLRKILNL